MRVLGTVAAVMFVFGAAMLTVGVVNLRAEGVSRPKPVPFVNSEATPTPTPAFAPPTTAAPSAPTPAPTAPPYDGKVARLKIPKLNVDVAVEALGLTGDNELAVPSDWRDAGWYDIYPKPGFGKNSLFSAHYDYYPNNIGPFFYLAKLQLGDEIIVQMEDGREYRYQMISGKEYDVATIPMGDIIDPPTRPPGEEWITLITCGGTLIRERPGGPGYYTARDVVVGRRIP